MHPYAIPPSIVSAFSVTFTRLPDGRRDSFRLLPQYPRIADDTRYRHIASRLPIPAAPRWMVGLVSSWPPYPAMGAGGQTRHSINIRQIRGTDGAAVWDGFGVYALRSAVSLAVTIACVIWLYIS